MYLCLLLLLFTSCHVTWAQTAIIERDDAECAKRWDLPACGWHYIAYFPRIFRSGITENVVFQTHGFHNDVDVTVELLDSSKRVIQAVTQKAGAGELTSIPVVVPHDAPNKVYVQLTGRGKIDGGGIWQFTNKSEVITVENLGLTILIQTDRPIYKPGQLIRSRVVVVDSKLRPFNGKLDSVTITNPSDSIMRMWRDTQLVDGFASFELKTSVKPVLGKWKIKVATKTYKKDLVISVEKYVLPKFQVTLTPPSYLSKMTKTASAEVCAKYSYGKPVFGKMNATVCVKKKYNYYYGRRADAKESECETIAQTIDGCTTIEFDVAGMRSKFKRPSSSGRFGYWYSEPELVVELQASVKEKATGVYMSTSKMSKTILSKDVVLSIESPRIFKPGFPLSVKLIAKRPDDSKIATLFVDLHVRHSSGTNLLKKKVKIVGGVNEIELPTIPFQAKNLIIRISYKRERITPNESDWKRESSASVTLKPWYSPSHSYLNIKKLKTPATIGSTVTIKVGYTSVDTMPMARNITYSMMCAGNLVKSGTFSKDFVSAQPRFTFPPTTTTTTTITTTTTTTTLPKEGDSPITIDQRPIVPLIWRPDWRPDWWTGSATRPPMPNSFSTGMFSFTVDIERKMLPSCNMVVYYVRKGEVVADQTEIKVVNEFENQITMVFDKDEVKPGKPVKLTVKGAPNSRIAVAAVDKSIHFLAKGNDLKRKDILDIQNKLTIPSAYYHGRNRCSGSSYYFERQDFVDSEEAFNNIGVAFLSSMRIDVRPCEEGRPIMMRLESISRERPVAISRNLGIPGPKRKSGSGGSKKKSTKTKQKTKARTEFPETWLWTDERLSANGERVFDVRVPDTITTWYASGFGLSQRAGLGVANAAELRAFQPFFISLNLPYSVIRDEDVTVPAAIFSYLDNACITVKVSLAFSTEYKMVAGPNAKTCLCSGRTATVLFRIRPKKLGHIKVRIHAETLEDNLCAAGRPFSKDVRAADILERKLLVEPEGIKEEYARSSYFCPNTLSGNKFNAEMKLKLPDNLVPGSIFAKVTAMGDIMGSSLSNIDELLAMPYGCGEQNMLKFAPNIFVMNYLNSTKQVNNAIRTKALDYMRTGYQRELTYKHNNGAYSAFGDRDKEGSTWLSAFVLKSYAQARPWIEVDEKEIYETSKWLTELQTPSGCFEKVGKLHNKAMKGGVKSPATLTAYVLISLLEAGYRPDDRKIIEGAYKCVGTVFDKFKLTPDSADSYSLSIFAYLFAKLNHRFYGDAMDLLDKKAIKEDGMVHWEEKKANKDPEPVPYYYKARSTDIEQTSYVLLAKLTKEGKEGVDSAVSIVRWLAKQRNSLGGWSSTQDTVLAMQALAEFAEITYTGNTNIQVEVSTDGFDHSFDINANNKLVLQRVENVPVPSTLKIKGEGDGCALIQTSVKYNVKKVPVKPTFSVIHRIKTVVDKLSIRKSCHSQELLVCATWMGEEEESNMAIIDVQMISGFEADQETFDEIRGRTPNLKEIEVKEKSVMFYFSRIGKTPHCVTFRVDQTSNVRNAKPAPIKVYDYYDTGKSETVMYQFTKEHCGGRK